MTTASCTATRAARRLPCDAVVADFDGRPLVWVRADVARTRGQAIRIAIDSYEGPWWTDADFPRLRAHRRRLYAPHPSDTRSWRAAWPSDRAADVRSYFAVRDPADLVALP